MKIHILTKAELQSLTLRRHLRLLTRYFNIYLNSLPRKILRIISYTHLICLFH
jgi:hypothetical protein